MLRVEGVEGLGVFVQGLGASCVLYARLLGVRGLLSVSALARPSCHVRVSARPYTMHLAADQIAPDVAVYVHHRTASCVLVPSAMQQQQCLLRAPFTLADAAPEAF